MTCGQPLPQLLLASMPPTIEQHAWQIIHEYGPRWWNEYHERYPNSTASEKTKREKMAHYCVVAAFRGAPNVCNSPWRGMDTAPLGICIQLIALGFVDWIYAAYDDGRWRDANGTPVIGLAWRRSGG